MNRNEKLRNAMVHFWLQVDEINESVKRALNKRLNQIHSDLMSSIYSSRGQLTSRNLPNIVSNTLASMLNQLIQDVNESLIVILQRSRVAFPRFVNSAQTQTEALDLSLIDPFGLTDLGENNTFSKWSEILGITEEEAREIFAELLLFGLFLGDVWQIWLLKQRDQLRVRLAQVFSQIDSDTEPTDRILRDVNQVLADSLLGGSVTSAKFTLEGITSSILFQSIERMVRKTVENNPVIFSGRYLWLGILDSSICRRCASLHGRTFEFGEGPLPQLHPFCRCFIVPLIIGGGSVSGQSFDEWLRSQSADVQDEILGKRGGEMFRNGQVKFKDFIQFRGTVNPRERTIDQIERLGR